ncbi:MAG: MBL fold metallo-hydrolase [Streptosporangiaceae bacterium]
MSRLTDALRPAAFGAVPRGERLERILGSPQYSDGAFRNPTPIRSVGLDGGGPLAFVRDNLRDRDRRVPAWPIPLHPDTAADLARPPVSGLRVTWLGHSSVLTEIDGVRVLFDPVWGERCSPVPFLGPKRLHAAPLSPAGLGQVDAVVISHDHYDHLDLPSIRALAGTGTLFAVPLGVGAHLEAWGVPAARIAELDWHESVEVKGVTLTATPAQHFCGRVLRRGMTLWASWVAAGPDHRVFHSGDTGYFDGFTKIGAAYGPFDVSMIQIGAYSRFWPDVHMTPEEGVRTHLDLSGGALLPIHWATFNLAPHPWEEPAELTLAAGSAAGIGVAAPLPGQPFEPALGLPTEPWWKVVAAGGRPAPGQKAPVS